MASQNRHAAIVEALIEAKANPDAFRTGGTTVLCMAAYLTITLTHTDPTTNIGASIRIIAALSREGYTYPHLNLT